MLIPAFIFALELLLCNLVLQPISENTDTIIISTVIIVLTSFLVIISLSKVANNKLENDVNKFLIFGFLFRMAIMLWDVFGRDIFVLPNSEGDAVWYHLKSISFAFGSRAGEVNPKLYSFYVGQLYKFIGVQKITVEFIHVFLSMWSIVLIYKILVMMDVDPAIRKRTMLFACFLPNLALISSIFLQEPVIMFLLILSLFLYTLWWKSNNYFFLLIAVAVSVASAFLHIGGIVCGMGYLIVLFLVGNRKRKLEFSGIRVVAVVLMIMAVMVLITTVGSDLLGKVGGDISVESITSESEKHQNEGGGSNYQIGIQGLPAGLDIILNSPIRMIYFVFSPLPWEWRGLSDIIAFFGSTLFYILVVFNIIRAYKLTKGKDRSDQIWAYLFVLIIISLMFAFMFGWGVSSSGSVLRHREKFTYICIVMYAVTYEARRRSGITGGARKRGVINAG